MQEFGPTLIRTLGAAVAPASTGGVGELDFNFGNLEGAKILGVEYCSSSMLPSATGAVEAGLNFNGSVAAPVAAGDIFENDQVFAAIGIDFILSTNGATGVKSFFRDLRNMDIVIARNIALQVFTIATTSGFVPRVYFRRVLFTQAEVGGIIAFRR